MRRKIAKRRRRDILALGGVFEKEEWYGPKTMSRKENGYAAHVQYKGWRILSVGDDELEVYQSLLDCMKDTEEYPRIKNEKEDIK
jgi:hypothetical protein